MFESIKLPLYQVYDAFRQGFNHYEFALNIIFILIVSILSMIFYWDSINSRVSATSRCKRQMDIYNKNKGEHIVQAKDKSNNPLYKITYDANQNNTNVECTCKSGKYVNYFNNIPIRDVKKNQDVKIDKICSCDQYYNVGMTSENVLYDGEPGILRYMTTTDTDFFDNLVYASYSL